MFRKVVLPDPVKPTIETNSPSSTSKLASLSTCRTGWAEIHDFETFREGLTLRKPEDFGHVPIILRSGFHAGHGVHYSRPHRTQCNGEECRRFRLLKDNQSERQPRQG